MRKLTLLLIALATIANFSCSDPSSTLSESTSNDNIVATFPEGKVTIKDGLLNFENYESYDAFDKRLREDELFRSSFLSKYASSRLINQAKSRELNAIEKHVIDNVSVNNLIILDRNCAYMIGKYYVRFGKKGLYYAPLSVKDKIDWQNEGSIDLSVVKKMKYGKVDCDVVSKKTNARLQIHWGTNSALGGGDQFEFSHNSPHVGQKKYVTELFSYYEEYWYEPCCGSAPYYRQRFRLKIRSKLEWKTNGGWNPNATEWRTITPNFQWSAEFGDPSASSQYPAGGGSFGLNPWDQQEWYQNTDWERDIAQYSPLPSLNMPTSWRWFLTGSGTIHQQIHGMYLNNVPCPGHTTVFNW